MRQFERSSGRLDRNFIVSRRRSFGARSDDPYSDESESRNNFRYGNEGPCSMCLPACAAVLPCP
jgi:hypothetical protein